MPKTLCLDFDGVIHSYDSGWKGVDAIPDAPVDGALSFLFKAVNSGWDVCIFSSRSKSRRGRSAMKQWLKRHAGNMWHESPAGEGLERVTFPKFKPPATVSIDDRAITFRGTFPGLEELESFQPWNR